MICEAPRCVKIRVKRTNEPQSCVQSIIFSSINDIFSEKVNTCFTIHDKWKVYFYNYLIVIFFLHGMAVVLLMEKLLSNDCVECEKTRFSFRISASLSENVVASLQRKWFVAEWGAFPALKAWTISFLCYSIRNWLFFAPTFRGTSCPDLALTIKISSSTRKNGAILASLKDALIRRYHLSVLSCFTVLYGASIILWKKSRAQQLCDVVALLHSFQMREFCYLGYGFGVFVLKIVLQQTRAWAACLDYFVLCESLSFLWRNILSEQFDHVVFRKL